MQENTPKTDQLQEFQYSELNVLRSELNTALHKITEIDKYKQKLFDAILRLESEVIKQEEEISNLKTLLSQANTKQPSPMEVIGIKDINNTLQSILSALHLYAENQSHEQNNEVKVYTDTHPNDSELAANQVEENEAEPLPNEDENEQRQGVYSEVEQNAGACKLYHLLYPNCTLEQRLEILREEQAPTPYDWAALCTDEFIAQEHPTLTFLRDCRSQLGITGYDLLELLGQIAGLSSEVPQLPTQNGYSYLYGKGYANLPDCKLLLYYWLYDLSLTGEITSTTSVNSQRYEEKKSVLEFISSLIKRSELSLFALYGWQQDAITTLSDVNQLVESAKEWYEITYSTKSVSHTRELSIEEAYAVLGLSYDKRLTYLTASIEEAKHKSTHPLKEKAFEFIQSQRNKTILNKKD